MKNILAVRPLLAGGLAIVGMSLGCGETPTKPTPPPAELKVASLTPNTGASGLATAVRINGTGFESGTTLTFDDIAVTATFVNGTTLTATAPPHAVGPIDVVVTNPGGRRSRLERAFTYIQGPIRTLRGFVGDSIHRPLVGATVEVLDGPQAGSVEATDGSGWFTLIGALEDSHRLRVTKEGHVSATGTIDFWRADGPPDYVTILLAVLAPPVSIAGDYSLTFVADDACTTVPDELRTRTYAVTIEPGTDQRNPAGTFLWANIIGVSFLANQRRIPILIASDVVSFWLGEHGYGAFFVEQVAPNTYLQFDGGATVSAGQSPVSSLSTTFEGAVDYCVMGSPMTGLYYDCDPSRAVTNVHCVSKQHRLTLTRR